MTRAGATRTLAAFADFYRRLALTEAEAASLDERRRTVTDAVHRRCAGLGAIGTVVGMGSSMRMTVVRPFAEIDIAIVFHVPDLLAAMRDYTPDTMIHEIAEAMASLGVGVETWRGEAVRLHFDSPPAVDLLPAFAEDAAGGRAMYFPRAGTAWLRTNPVALDRLFLARNAEVGGRLIPTAVLLKAWNREAGAPFQSWILETILLRNAARLTGHHGFDCAAFFRTATTALDRLLDARSADGFCVLSAMMDASRRTQAVAAAAEADQTARDALAAEQADDDATAVAAWGHLFGPDFPASPPDRPSRGLVLRPRQPEGFVEEMINRAATAELLEDSRPIGERESFRCRLEAVGDQVIEVEGPMPAADFLDRLRTFAAQGHDPDALIRFVREWQPGARVTVTRLVEQPGK